MQQGGVGHAFRQDLVFGTKNVAIVLSEPAHAHDAVQTTGGFIAVALAEFAVAQGQITVTFQALFEDQDVPRTVHGFEGVVPFFGLGGEHVVTVLVPVAGFFPQGLVQQLRGFHLLIAIVSIDLSHVLLHHLPDRPAFGVPEDHARRVIIHMEQVKLTAEFAVVAFFSLFQHR